jgi:hypothetical protein
MHVEIFFMKVDYNMLSKKITFWGGGAMVEDLTPNVEVRNSSPHTCNLGYLRYLGDLIR